MSAFIFKTKLLNFSVNDIGITIYFKLPTSVTEYAAKFTFGFYGLFFENSNPLKMAFENALKTIEQDYPRSLLAIINNVNGHEENHSYFHNDPYDIEEPHIHLVFSHMDKDMLKQMLGTLVRYHLVSVREKEACLKSYDERFYPIKEDVNFKYLLDAEYHSKQIIKSIKNCMDNDILVFLYAYLSTEKFNYLRCPSSTHWAGIKDALQLQVQHNFELQSSQLDEELKNRILEKNEFLSCVHSSNLQQTEQHLITIKDHSKNSGEKTAHHRRNVM